MYHLIGYAVWFTGQPVIHSGTTTSLDGGRELRFVHDPLNTITSGLAGGTRHVILKASLALKMNCGRIIAPNTPCDST